MLKIIRAAFFAFVSFLFVSDIATADSWVGQGPPAQVNGPLGPYPDTTLFYSQQISIACVSNFDYVPCTGLQTRVYQSVDNGAINAIPNASGIESSLKVLFAGVYSDPNSPTGISGLGGGLPLSAFARASSLTDLTSTVGTLSGIVSELSARMASLSRQFDGAEFRLQQTNRIAREGVAISLAMAGLSDLAPDEKFAISMNIGAFGGQNGVAAGFAVRAGEHLSVNGGVGMGFYGGAIGGRAGIRFAR